MTARHRKKTSYPSLRAAEHAARYFRWVHRDMPGTVMAYRCGCGSWHVKRELEPAA